MIFNKLSGRKLTIFCLGLLLALLGGVLAYQYKCSDFITEVYVQYPDGSLQRVSPDANGIYYEPSIDPEGKFVSFFGAETGQPRLWLADLNTGRLDAITPTTFAARHPSFSPDGKSLTFVSNSAFDNQSENINEMLATGTPPADEFTNIFISDINGENMRQLTSGYYQDQRPSFSPDGSVIAFVSNRSGEERIWKIDISVPSAEPELLIGERYAYRPNFSPDGKWLYFFTHVGSRHQICRKNLLDLAIECMENDNEGYSHGPFVEPNGEYLLMHSTRNKIGLNWGIWKLPLDGSVPTEIKMNNLRSVLHASISKNGIIAFDTIKKPEPLETMLSIRQALYEVLYDE